MKGRESGFPPLKKGDFSAFGRRRNSAGGHVFGDQNARENADGNKRKDKADMQEIYDGSGNKQTDDISHRPDAPEKIDDVHIAAVNAFVKI